jgi:hypothetical protein
VILVLTRRPFLTLLTFLIGAAVAAVVLWIELPSPPGNPNLLFFLCKLALLTLVGPIGFVWAAGPHPMNLFALTVAFAVPTTAIAMLFFGYIRKGSLAALVLAAALWSVFGGYSAHLAATGSI